MHYPRGTDRAPLGRKIYYIDIVKRGNLPDVALKVAIFCDPQARLAELDTPRRLENLQKLEELKKHLMDLEKQVKHTFHSLPSDIFYKLRFWTGDSYFTNDTNVCVYVFEVHFVRLLMYEMLEFTHVIFQINISYSILNCSNQQ